MGIYDSSSSDKGDGGLDCIKAECLDMLTEDDLFDEETGSHYSDNLPHILEFVVNTPGSKQENPSVGDLVVKTGAWCETQ